MVSEFGVQTSFDCRRRLVSANLFIYSRVASMDLRFWYLPVQHGRSDWKVAWGLSTHQRNELGRNDSARKCSQRLRPNQVLKGWFEFKIRMIMVILSSSDQLLLNNLSGLEKVDPGHILIQGGQDLSRDAQWRPFDGRRLPLATFQQYYLLPNLARLEQMRDGGGPCKQSWFLQIIERR